MEAMNSVMRNKITLITGANSGLGKATAIGLARMDATVIMVARSREKGEVARREIMAASGNNAVELIVADLSSQQAIRQLVADFTAQHDKLHVLINNVGNSFYRRSVTVDGIESSLAINHLASFLLTNLLLPTLKASTPARIVNVGTRLNTAMDFDDLQFEKRPYDWTKVYGQTKLGNIHFTFELARHLQDTGVTVNVVHPGVFRSNLGTSEPGPRWMSIITTLGRPFLASADRAAERVLYLATSPEVEGISGKYYGNKVELPAPPQTLDIAANRQLWDISEQLTGLTLRA